MVFPCYNESPIFEDSVNRISRYLGGTRLDYEVIFVEDRSADNTKELIQKAVKKNRRFRAIYHEKNTGRGGCVADGFRAANGEVVGYLDIDLEIAPSYVLEMYAAVKNGSDAVCAVRSYEFTVKNFFRNFLHFVYLVFSKFLLALPVSDPNAGCKFFDRKKILPILGRAVDTHWFWDTEIVKRAQLAGLKVTEIPVLYVANTKKKSSVRVFSDTLHFVSRVLWLKKELREVRK
ncbi:MAG: glycosyltransferase family 2 protein [archaeon]|nr:glycosyltransferase family 2 protein [archaeon]